MFVIIVCDLTSWTMIKTFFFWIIHNLNQGLLIPNIASLFEFRPMHFIYVLDISLSNLENWLNWMSPVSYFVFILRGACRYCKLFAKIYVYIVIFMNKHTFFIQHGPVICCPEFWFQQKNQPDQRESDFKLLHLCSNHTPHFPINKKTMFH